MLKTAVIENRIEVVDFLLKNKLVDMKDEHLLHLAVEKNYVGMASRLLEVCDINEYDKNGNTPLHLVSSQEMLELLLQHGARANIKNFQGKYPYETVSSPELVDILRRCYFKSVPQMMSLLESASENLISGERFISDTFSIADLEPVGSGRGDEDFLISVSGEKFLVTDRFISSFARKMKFSTNIFNYFTGEEVFERVSQYNPDIRLKITLDIRENKLLGVVDENKKILSANIAYDILKKDTRAQSIEYRDGVYTVRFLMDQQFEIKNDSSYAQEFWLHYPVDGIGNPCIYLAAMRLVCENGVIALVPAFRTDLQIADTTGWHLARLLRSYDNINGFSALRRRIQSAQTTTASVREFLKLDSILNNQFDDRKALASIKERLEEVAGDPCARYGVTSLGNIANKKQPLLPVDCSVNDLIAFYSELTTHHGELIRKKEALNTAIGTLLAEEYDLEGVYPLRKETAAFHLQDIFKKNANAS